MYPSIDIELCNMIVKHFARSFLIKPDLLCEADKGAPQGLCSDILHQTSRHLSKLAHGWLETGAQ